MPRYFFHVSDGDDYPDLHGTELPDLSAARNEAVRFAGALLSDHGEKFWTSGEWTMRVANEDDLTLFQLTFFSTDSAAGSKA
jgi:hypothetical protein